MSRNHNGHSLNLVAVQCGECGKPAKHQKGDIVYPHRQDLFEKDFYVCDCGAQVGCHPGTLEPLGQPVGKATRTARSRAHAHFDALYKEVARLHPDRGAARKRGYRWLGEKLGISADQCHIGMMDAATARKVVDICLPEMRRLGIGPETR